MIPDSDGGSTMTMPEAAKLIMSKEKHELVPQLRFAPGYHFRPTDFELIDVYLRGKINGLKPPLDIFMDVNFLESEPDKLIAERKAYGEDTYFFFTVRQEWPSNKKGQPRRKLQVKGVKASWKATGSVVPICHPVTREVVGTRRMLTYSSGRRNEDKYSMYEYVLNESEIDQWVLCTIKEKQHWDDNVDEDKNASTGGIDKKASGGIDKKRKRGTETRVKPTTTTRKKKKTATSQLEETQPAKEQQQEIASGVSSDPPPLLTDEQVHHQALHGEGVMAFHMTSPTIQVVAPHHEYPDGDQPYYHGTTAQEETTTWDGPATPPLMPSVMHQQGYQASSMEEEQFGAQYMSHHQFSTMAQFHPQQQYLTLQYQEQQQPHDMYELLSLVSSMEHTRCEFLQQQVQGQFRMQGFHGDVTGPLPDVSGFLCESGKPPQTSPDSVLGGPDPGPPSGDAYPYSDSDAGMMKGIASTVDTQATPDHQFNPVDFPGHNFGDNLESNGSNSNVATGLPDHGSNQALHTCQHGVQWRRGGQQGVDMESCFQCVTLCAKHHSI